MNSIVFVLLVQAFASLSLVGLIWTIQIVHYPLFDHVDPSKWVEFHQSHSARISVVVGPMMAAEGLTALWLLIRRPASISPLLTWGGAVLVAVVLGATVSVSVPFHHRLGKRFSADAHRQLVLTNWVRTIGWTMRGVIACLMIASYLKPLGS